LAENWPASLLPSAPNTEQDIPVFCPVPSPEAPTDMPWTPPVPLVLALAESACAKPVVAPDALVTIPVTDPVPAVLAVATSARVNAVLVFPLVLAVNSPADLPPSAPEAKQDMPVFSPVLSPPALTDRPIACPVPAVVAPAESACVAALLVVVVVLAENRPAT